MPTGWAGISNPGFRLSCRQRLLEEETVGQAVKGVWGCSRGAVRDELRVESQEVIWVSRGHCSGGRGMASQGSRGGEWGFSWSSGAVAMWRLVGAWVSGRGDEVVGSRTAWLYGGGGAAGLGPGLGWTSPSRVRSSSTVRHECWGQVLEVAASGQGKRMLCCGLSSCCCRSSASLSHWLREDFSSGSAPRRMWHRSCQSMDK